MKLDQYSIPYTKINSKWMKDLNIRAETIKLLEESIGGKLLATDLGNDVIVTPKVKAKAKVNKWGSIKLKGFAYKGNTQQNKQGENICTSYT